MDLRYKREEQSTTNSEITLKFWMKNKQLYCAVYCICVFVCAMWYRLMFRWIFNSFNMHVHCVITKCASTEAISYAINRFGVYYICNVLVWKRFLFIWINHFAAMRWRKQKKKLNKNEKKTLESISMNNFNVLFDFHIKCACCIYSFTCREVKFMTLRLKSDLK